MPRANSRWRVVRETPVVDNGFVRVAERVVTWGEDPQEHSFTVTHDPDYIQVVGITTGRQVVMIVQDHLAEGVVLQLIAGNTRGCRSSQEAAQKELGEEGGWRARRWHLLGTHVPQTDRIISATPGTDGAKRCTMYLATGLQPTDQRLEDTEKLQVHLVPLEVAFSAALTGNPVPDIGLPIMDCGSRLALILAERFLISFPQALR